MMSRRVSPIRTGMREDRVMDLRGWQIAMTYLGEKYHNPLFITDLSHIQTWTLQGRDLDKILIKEITIPSTPGRCTFINDILITRLTPVECRIMTLETRPLSFPGQQCIEITDAFASFAVMGSQCLEVLNKLCPIDLDEPGHGTFYAVLGPVEDVTCLIIRLVGKGGIPGIIISGARGYGQFLFEIFLDAGKEYNLSIAGWQRFKDWYRSS